MLWENPSSTVSDEMDARGEDALGGKYNGPADERSHPSHPRLIQAGVNVALPLMCRVRVHGQENLDTTGKKTLIVYDHPASIEPLVVKQLMGQQDVRFMAMKGVFVGPLTPLLVAAGAYPVDRAKPSSVAKGHGADLIHQGVAVAIAPSGGNERTPDQLGPYHMGAASNAVHGGADQVIGIVVDHHPANGSEATHREKAAGLLAAAGFATGATLLAVLGGPVGAGVAIGGAALAGAFIGAAAANKAVRPARSLEAPLRMGVKAVAGLVGAGAGAAAGVALLAAAPVLAPVLLVAAGTVAVLGMARGWQKRPVLEAVVCDPIPVQPVVKQYGEQEAIPQLTREMQNVMGPVKAELTGQPYDGPVLYEKRPRPA
jgi:1-acyl-sn-glycerol-3-phosphate acyltransferase